MQLALYSSGQTLALLYYRNPTRSRDLIGLLNTFYLSLLSLHQIYTSGLPTPASLMAQTEDINLNDTLVSHFIADLAYGHFLDRPNMEIVTGYIHHGVYTVIMFYLRQTQQSNLIYLCLPFEIPTVLMNLNRFDPKKRLSLPFGVSFLLFRVLYNVYVISSLRTNLLHASLATLMLIIHTHWFTIWTRKFVNRNR